MFIKNINEIDRQAWLKQFLTALPQGARILDAGAGELKNRQYCGHLDYVSQDFCQYQGGDGAPDEGLQTDGWDTTRIDLVSDITAIPAPYHYCSGFSKYWYEYHLAQRGFRIQTLTANGDWYALLLQEITRLGGLERQRGNWAWPFAYVYALLGLAYYKLRSNKRAEDLACFGWQCVALKKS